MPSFLISRKKAEELKREGVKLDKVQAGSLGGQRTLRRFGKTYMHNLAVRGAIAQHKKYRLVKVGTCDFALVDRGNKPTGKTIRG
jgi:hypothetical protein